MARRSNAKPADAEPFDYVSAEKDEETAFPLRARKRDWRALLKPLRSEQTYEDLEKIECEVGPAKTADTRRRIPINELVVAENVFQWRGRYSNLQAQDAHMRELVRALETGKDLEPVTVITLGEKLYLVDGHHRLAAYVAVKKETVPVLHFKGTLHEAWLRSLAANVRDKLPITREDKFEAAFTLVKHKVRRGLDMSCEDIAHRAVVSPRLVYKMQAMLKEALSNKNKDQRDNPFEWSWGKTQWEAKDEDDTYDSEDFIDTQARKMADQIMAKVSMNLTANPAITARALRMISEHLPRELIDEWFEEVEDVLLGQAEQTSEEVVDAFRAAFKRLRSDQEAL
jgi:hypothetical protein